MIYFVFATLLAFVMSHDSSMPINSALGVPGYPDCYQPNSDFDMNDVETNAATLKCFQRPKLSATALSIGCVGDSITAGVHSSGGNHTYPGQLQLMLDPTKYTVTNLGACGSTMQKKANSPYWDRPQYKTLTANKWDIIVIMLGTNDAKDPGDGGPSNWLDNCGPLNKLDLAGCTFAEDFASFISVVRGLGTTAAGPDIYVAIPPPLMQKSTYGMNQTAINSVYPLLVPMIHDANKLVTKPIDIYTAMGGVQDWATKFPSQCTNPTPSWAPCSWYCDDQSCDQCHPNDAGYNNMAKAMKAGLGL